MSIGETALHCLYSHTEQKSYNSTSSTSLDGMKKGKKQKHIFHQNWRIDFLVDSLSDGLAAAVATLRVNISLCKTLRGNLLRLLVPDDMPQLGAESNQCSASCLIKYEILLGACSAE